MPTLPPAGTTRILVTDMNLPPSISTLHLRVEVVVLVQEAHHGLERLLDGRQRIRVRQRDLALLAYLQVLF